MNSLSKIVENIKSAKAPGKMLSKVIAIDGPGGAGKSTLAATLAKALGDAPIIHTDDFASRENPLNWWPRVIKQVLEPLSVNKPARYWRYDWNTRLLAEWHVIRPVQLIILEGVSSSREAFRPYLAFSIWVDTPRDERLRRGLARDGENARQQWEQWMAEEDNYIEKEDPIGKADVVVSGTEALI